MEVPLYKYDAGFVAVAAGDNQVIQMCMVLEKISKKMSGTVDA